MADTASRRIQSDILFPGFVDSQKLWKRSLGLLSHGSGCMESVNSPDL